MIELAILLVGVLFLLPLMATFAIAYDVESTGKSPMTDRIVQICLTRIDSDGQRTVLINTLVNPQMPISEGATKVHRITDADVADAPTFAQIASQLESFFDEAEAVIGYNSTKFDNTMLDEEFLRNNINFSVSSKPQIDIKRLLEHVEPRDLNSVSERYLGRTIEGAHDASVDVEATLDIMDRLKEIGNMTSMRVADVAVALNNGSITGDGRIVWDEERATIAFGKLDGEPLFDAVRADRRYFDWIINTADPGEYTWITRDLCNCIRMAIHAPDEDTMNEVISERYGHPPHDCEEHIDITQNVYPNEDGYDVEEWAFCSICSKDMSLYVQEMYEDYEPDEDWGRDR